MAKVRRIDNLDDLRQLAKIRDVVYFELHGRRRDGFETDPKVEQGTNVSQLTEGNRLTTRFRTLLQGGDGTYVVDLAVVFDFPEKFTFDPKVLQVFAGTVAFPIAHPFIREALRDMASKLGLKRPILQLLPPEGIELEEEPSGSQETEAP